MRILKTEPHLTDDELKKNLHHQNDIRKFKNWQIIYSVQTNQGRSAEDFANILCVNIHKIYRVIEAYNKDGAEWDANIQYGGRREEVAYLTIEEEKKLLRKIEKKALEGSIITAFDIKDEVEAEVGFAVSNDYIWDLFKRHNWKKKSPRPKHPEKDKSAQEQFKKNSKKIWLPPR